MLVGMPRISTAFKDSRWSSSVVTPQNPHAICIQHYYGIREKESGSRTCPSFEDTTVGRSVCKRAPREYLYTTLGLVAVEECSGRGTIRLYEATCISRHAPSKSARFIISLVSTTNLAVSFEARYDFRSRNTKNILTEWKRCSSSFFFLSLSFLFRARGPGRKEAKIRSEIVWSLLLNFNTTGRGVVVMKFPPTLFSHQQNKYFPSYERQQFNLVAGGEAGNWFRDTELFAKQHAVDETMSEGERER